MFPQVFQNNIQQELLDGRTRHFVGKGTTAMPVPGLRSLEQVRIGPAAKVLPTNATKSMQRAKRGKEAKAVEVEVPLVKLIHTPDGIPMLARAIFSNDGIWQDGMDVYVTGDWEGDVSLDDDDTAAIAYDGMSKGDLVALATDRGINVKPSWTAAKVKKALVKYDQDAADEAMEG
jgi:hypothetical protein